MRLLCEARLIEGLRDEEVQAAFHAARDADYADVADVARKLAAAPGRPSR
jgi:hypothetical protein